MIVSRATLLLALGSCAAPGEYADVPPQSASLLFGSRDLDGGWSPGDDQQVYGVLLEIHEPEGGEGFELGGLRGVNDGSGTIDNLLEEFFLGTHFESPPIESLILWFGCGLTFARGELGVESDTGLGGYVQGGARLYLGDGFSFGAGVRWTDIEKLELSDRRLDPSYVQGFLVFGVHF